MNVNNIFMISKFYVMRLAQSLKINKFNIVV